MTRHTRINTPNVVTIKTHPLFSLTVFIKFIGLVGSGMHVVVIVDKLIRYKIYNNNCNDIIIISFIYKSFQYHTNSVKTK